MNKYNFVKFSRDNSRGDSRISITKANALRFASGFFRENNLQNFKYVLLYFDSEKKAIGILPTNQEQKGIFKITKERAQGSGSVSIESFLKANSLEVNIYQGKYKPIKQSVEGIGELYIIELKK